MWQNIKKKVMRDVPIAFSDSKGILQHEFVSCHSAKNAKTATER